MTKKAGLLLGTLGFLLIAFVVGANFYNQKQVEKVSTLAQDDKALFVRPYSQSLGSPMSRVTLVEFLDPECEACKQFAPIVKEILKEFDGSIRFVIRYAPFHGNSKFAVQLLEAAAKQGKYWETLEVFFKNQPQWGDHHNPKPDLLWGYIKEVGLDVEKIKKDMKDPSILKNLEQDVADGLKLGVRRTPTFFVNGKQLTNFGVEPLKELIRSELN